MATLTDAASRRLSGIQHVYLSSQFRSPDADVVPAVYTDHDFLVARARLVPHASTSRSPR
jgi:hypothetical protein